jgi:hypothetical protein
VVRLDSGNLVCGRGGGYNTIHLFGLKFDEISSKPLDGWMLSALIVKNSIYCGLSDSSVVVFDKNLNEIKKVKLSSCV